MRSMFTSSKAARAIARVTSTAILLAGTLIVAELSEDVIADRHTGSEVATGTVNGTAHAHAGWALAVYVFDGNEASGVFFGAVGGAAGAALAKSLGKGGGTIGAMIGGPIGAAIGLGLGAL